MKDWKWLCLCPEFSDCNAFSFGQWFESIRVRFESFEKQVIKFARSRVANSPTGHSPAGCIKVMPGSPRTHQCSICPLAFNTFKKLALHSFEAHGIKHVSGLFVAWHIHCSACLKLLWNRERLINHVRYCSKVCKFNMTIRGPVCCVREQMRLTT